MDEIIYLSATNMARMIRQREVSSVELVDAHLKRIEEVNPKLNAVVQVDGERALAAARRADEALARGEGRTALHGVPMTIKDSLDTADMITTGGTKGRSSFVPERDATVVARLRSAGAILLGKTNTPELTLAGETDNLIYGQTNNPYDLSRSPGGSSGGAAAIIATGGSPLDLGSDTGGSIRSPAHYCGIAGIKPTSGRVPRTGHIVPFGMGALDSLTQIGPLARYVEDLALILPLLVGVDWLDPGIIPMPLSDPDAIALKGLRVAVYTDNGIIAPTPETAATVHEVAKGLEAAGMVVEEALPPALVMTNDLYYGISKADGQAWVRRLLQKAGTTEMSPVIGKRLEESEAIDTPRFTFLLEELDRFRSEMLSFMKNYDLILCPADAFPALPHGAPQRDGRYGDFSHTSAYNLTGWPGAVVRAGTSPEGLPIGVQVVAGAWREDVVLAVARSIESLYGGWKQPPL